jgi:hypothetical protein
MIASDTDPSLNGAQQLTGDEWPFRSLIALCYVWWREPADRDSSAEACP